MNEKVLERWIAHPEEITDDRIKAYLSDSGIEGDDALVLLSSFFLYRILHPVSRPIYGPTANTAMSRILMVYVLISIPTKNGNFSFLPEDRFPSTAVRMISSGEERLFSNPGGELRFDWMGTCWKKGRNVMKPWAFAGTNSSPGLSLMFIPGFVSLKRN